ncbi:MAG: 2-C-methyl-D-erythritol 4-phosphate cytidylyltransferase [Chloroflexi bacterium]|nr:2-C-methyl-D-erythritol 4-phosphate cytidylyltransferase [Chloroflexota bacterium]
MPDTCAIIVAAGESRRMNGIDKMFAPLGGRPLLARTLQPFQDSPLVDTIILVVHAGRLEKCRRLVAEEGFAKVSEVCEGGARRQDSVTAGLARAGRSAWVIVHDGARPLVTPGIIADGLQSARETGAAVAAVPVKDTIKIAGDDRIVRATPPRNEMWSAQTPQVFRFDIINDACRRAGREVTDDASLVEQAGYRVKLYMGSYENIKVTTPDDLALARLLWKKHGR